MPEKSLLSLLKGFKPNKKNKTGLIQVKLSKINISISSVLLKEGLIRGYFVKNNYSMNILLKFVDDSNIVNFKLAPFLKKKAYNSNNDFTCYNSCILSTRKGILSHKDALKYKVDGFPLLNFS